MKIKAIDLFTLVLTLVIALALPFYVTAATFTNDKVSFTFNKDAEEFGVPVFMKEQVTLENANNALKLTMHTDTRPPIIQRLISPTISGPNYKWAYIRMKNEGMGTAGVIAFSSLSKGIGEHLGIDDNSQKIVFAISKEDTEYKDYYVDLTKNAKWNQFTDIDMVRLIVGADWAYPDYSVYIEKIELLAEKPDNTAKSSTPASSKVNSSKVTSTTVSSVTQQSTADSVEESSEPQISSEEPISSVLESNVESIGTPDEDSGNNNLLKIIIIAAAILVLAGAATASYFIYKKRTKI